jgi:two-component system chemotaxis response regulator CheB
MICLHQLKEILQCDGQIEVVGEGSRGEEALALIEKHHPNMFVVDLVMPGLGGQETVAQIMAKHPLPILVLTAQPEGVRQVAVFDALRRGALDLAEKPRRGDKDAEERLRRSVRTLAQVPVVRHLAGNLPPAPPRAPNRVALKTDRTSEPKLTREQKSTSDSPTRDSHPPSCAPARKSDEPSEPPVSSRTPDGVAVVGIGASAGGPTPLAALLGGLPSNFPAAIGVVQHLPIGFTDAFIEYLRSRIALTVKKVVGRELIRPGVVYLPTDDRHLVATNAEYFATSAAPASDGHRPSVDVLLSSLAEIYGPRASGVILSGIGQDGVRGLLAMREQGALTMAQSEESCAVFGMPQAALNWGAARLMLAPDAMVKELERFVSARGPRRLAQ